MFSGFAAVRVASAASAKATADRASIFEEGWLKFWSN